MTVVDDTRPLPFDPRACPFLSGQPGRGRMVYFVFNEAWSQYIPEADGEGRAIKVVFARGPDVVGFSRSCRFDDCQSRRNSGREAPFGCEASSAFLLVPRLRTVLEQRA